MMVSLSNLRPFICRPITNSNFHTRVVTFDTSDRPSFQAITRTSYGFTTYSKSSLFGLQCYNLKTSTLNLTRSIWNPSSPSVFVNKVCRPRCYSSFVVKSLWENEDVENKSKFEIKTEQNKPTLRTVEPTIGFKSFSDKQDEFINFELEQACKPTKNVIIDWNDIKNSTLEINGCINEENIDAIIIKKCCGMKSLQLGKSFFKYLKSSMHTINRATYGNYLRLFYDCSSECNETDLNEIYDIYEELQHIYQDLDSNTAEKVVLALSLTKHWKEYVKLFEVIEKIYFPTSIAYSAVVRAAFKNNERELGWSLMEEMQNRGINVPDDVFACILDTSKKSTKDEELSNILEFMSKFNMKPSVNLSGIVKRTFEGISKDRRGTYTSVLRSGTCKYCQSDLEPAWVSPEDYEELKTAFLNPVLIGKDIFLKTKPEEFNKFLAFLEKAAPFDVVLDGLNIAFKNKKHKISSGSFAHQLKCVVEHFASMKKKVLVLGRKHMTKWKAEDMQIVYDNADVFFAEDMSHDDPFLLYATLYSGLGTCFVSQDMMRGHKFLLANTKLQTTFKRWQAQHQYFIHFIDDKGSVNLRDPIPFVQNIQRNRLGDWHIPYDKKENLTIKTVVDNFHRHWLCLTNQPPQQTRPLSFNPERRSIPKRYKNKF